MLLLRGAAATHMVCTSCCWACSACWNSSYLHAQAEQQRRVLRFSCSGKHKGCWMKVQWSQTSHLRPGCAVDPADALAP